MSPLSSLDVPRGPAPPDNSESNETYTHQSGNISVSFRPGQEVIEEDDNE